MQEGRGGGTTGPWQTFSTQLRNFAASTSPSEVMGDDPFIFIIIFFFYFWNVVPPHLPIPNEFMQIQVDLPLHGPSAIQKTFKAKRKQNITYKIPLVSRLAQKKEKTFSKYMSLVAQQRQGEREYAFHNSATFKPQNK